MMDMSNTPDPRIGTVLDGRYRIIERIGMGGMAVVYRGERVELGRPVAIKFLQEVILHHPKLIGRFEAEAKAMSKLSNPYCVSVIDFGVDGAPYIVMDYVEGKTLSDILESERVAPSRAIRIVRQILAGIAHAHSHGIVHRDLKPGNVMLQNLVGVGESVRIFDFGLAKLTDAASGANMSMSLMAGTPNYMSPEQSRGTKVDERTDLYAIGVVLFELLSGEKPFSHEDYLEVVRMHRETVAPGLNEISGQGAFSEQLQAVVRKALSKAPEDRYQTAREFTIALDGTEEGSRAQETDASVPPDPHDKTVDLGDRTPGQTTGPTMRPRRRLRVLAAIAAVVVGVLVLVAVRYFHESQPPGKAIASDAPDEAAMRSHKGAKRAPSVPAAEKDKGPAAAPGESDGAGTEISSLKDINRLIEEGDTERAIRELQTLRGKQPRDARIVYMLGDLFFKRKWWADAIDRYAEAIKLDPAYGKNESIQRDLIAALGNDKLYFKASAMLSKSIGKPALPALQRASEENDNVYVRRRARAVIKKIESEN
jgi:serine/threonine-protein kinase